NFFWHLNYLNYIILEENKYGLIKETNMGAYLDRSIKILLKSCEKPKGIHQLSAQNNKQWHKEPEHH
ncbi:hypothetical protein ACJX0J_035659, partial [Zea mays]